jgi:predicted esterase
MDKVEDEKGMMKTIHALNSLITTEIDAGTPASRILLGGFSQGGAMTVATGLTTERKLAGLAVMSGWAPMRNTLKTMLSDHFKQIPIFWGHGTRDPIVRYDVGKASEAWLESVGVKKAATSGDIGLDFHAYEGVEHSASQQELLDLQNFIAEVLPEST